MKDVLDREQLQQVAFSKQVIESQNFRTKEMLKRCKALYLYLYRFEELIKGASTEAYRQGLATRQDDIDSEVEQTVRQ